MSFGINNDADADSNDCNGNGDGLKMWNSNAEINSNRLIDV